MAHTTLTRTAARSDTAPSPLIAPAAAVYVLAWIVGLALGPGQVGAEASDAEVRDHYLAGATMISAQATLVHLVAGTALMVLAFGLASLIAAQRARAAALVAGLLAGVLSVAQALVAYAAVAQAADQPAAWSRTMLDTIGTLDIVKILLLATFVALASMSLTDVRVPRVVRIVGVGTTVLLVLGAASFVVSSTALQAALALSLVLLLLWVGTIGVIVGRARRTGAAS